MDMDGTSSLSPYLRFGMLGLRQAVSAANQAMSEGRSAESKRNAEVWLNELIWREFYIQILYHFPHVSKGYRLFISPALGASCRFEPSCSTYALQALEQHGALAGSYLTVRRITRCQPWCEGGHDPVPGEKPRLFTHQPSPTGRHVA